MGFSNLGIIMQCIDRVYDIDSEIKSLNDQKMNVANEARELERGSRYSGQSHRGNPFGGGMSMRSRERFLSEKEKQIDQELERLKAMRVAVQAQKEEFQKYISENIKKTFGNSYMS